MTSPVALVSDTGPSGVTSSEEVAQARLPSPSLNPPLSYLLDVGTNRGYRVADGVESGH